MSTATTTRAEGPRLPTRAELYRATDATRATMNDPAASVLDRYKAAENEAAALHAFEQRHGSQTQADIGRWHEKELEAG